MVKKTFKRVLFTTLICLLSGCSSIGTGDFSSSYVTPETNDSSSSRGSGLDEWWLGKFELSSFSCDVHGDLDCDYLILDFYHPTNCHINWSVGGVEHTKTIRYEYVIAPNLFNRRPDGMITHDPFYNHEIRFKTDGSLFLGCLDFKGDFHFRNEDTLWFWNEYLINPQITYSDSTIVDFSHEGTHRCRGAFTRIVE